MRFAQNLDHLEITMLGQGDKLIVKDWHLSAANQIEEFRFSDGSKVLASQALSLVSAMAVFSASACIGTGWQETKTFGTPVNQLAASSIV